MSQPPKYYAGAMLDPEEFATPKRGGLANPSHNPAYWGAPLGSATVVGPGLANPDQKREDYLREVATYEREVAEAVRQQEAHAKAAAEKYGPKAPGRSVQVALETQQKVNTMLSEVTQSLVERLAPVLRNEPAQTENEAFGRAAYSECGLAEGILLRALEVERIVGILQSALSRLEL